MNLLYFLVSLCVNPTVLVVKSLRSGYIASSILNTFWEQNYVRIWCLDKKNLPDLDVSQKALKLKEESQCHSSSWCFGYQTDWNSSGQYSQAGTRSSMVPVWSYRVEYQTGSSRTPWDSWFLPWSSLRTPDTFDRRSSWFRDCDPRN